MEIEEFKNKWYVREDFCPEQMPNNWSLGRYKYMKSVRNCFDSKEEALTMANAIRTLLGVTILTPR